jgi:hypothetical protein
MSEKHSPEPWQAARLDVSGADEFKAYTARCIDEGSPGDFYIVLVQKPDGPADACHTGNGPASAANARRIVACVNACAGLSTEALEAGALSVLLDATGKRNELDRSIAYHEAPGGNVTFHDGPEDYRRTVAAVDRVKTALRALGRLP